MKKFLKILLNKLPFFIAIGLVIFGVLVAIYYLKSLYSDGFIFWGGEKIDNETTGQVGDFIGGFIGTIIATAGFIFLYLTLKEQRSSFQTERFESKFFELLKLHRDNVNDLKYTKCINKKDRTFENREVMREIFFEFIDCFKEVKKISKKDTVDDYFTDDYKKILEDIIMRNKIAVNITDLALIDIAYSIVFFGVENDGETVLLERFEKKYKKDFYSRILKNIKLKPNPKEEEYYIVWSELNEKSQEEIDKMFGKEIDMDDSTRNLFRRNKKYKENENISLLIDEFTKFYDGHQQRLGHYFRHLFQTYKFLDQNDNLDFETKYFFGKTLRAQFSTYEQALLFINSVSSLGMKWEYKFEYEKDSKQQKKIKEQKIPKAKYYLNFENYKGLITKYQLIKNLPGSHFSEIKFENYYPMIKYENSEESNHDNEKSFEDLNKIDRLINYIKNIFN